jgi:hypothetical protein
VLRLFGQEVLQAAAAVEGGDARDGWSPPRGGGGDPAAATPSSSRDGMQFAQFFRLVPAAGLRAAADAAAAAARGGSPRARFETLLRAADAGAAPGALLRRPSVLALALVWDSSRASPTAAAAVARAVAPTLDAGALFDAAPPGPPHALRAVVCYHGNHYRTYADGGGVDGWAVLDDAAVAPLPGGWPAAAAAIAASGAQPALLFYEEEGGGAAA